MSDKIKEFIKKYKHEFIMTIVCTLVIFIIWQNVISKIGTDIEKVSYPEFIELLEDNKIDTVYYNKANEWMTFTIFNEDTVNMSIQERLDYDDYSDNNIKMVLYSASEDFRRELLEHNVILSIVDEETSFLEVLSRIFTIAFPVFWIIILFSMMKNQIYTDIDKKEIIQTSDVKFKDVIGHDEILDDIKFISKLIQNPSIGENVGAKIPKGILLSGDPGCGKTLIAKAIAGEAGVPFLYQNASSFIDRFVGVGAKHVRELFKLAKQNAPCVVFIDEIDAVGMDRENNRSTSEHDQTIDALLQAMDGFSERDGIFIIAATNRPNVLDKALTRAGRFDRQIVVSKPRDWKVRKELLDHYLNKFKVSEDVNTENISKQITGFTGADIAAICNEASIVAIMNDKKFIDSASIEEAIDKKIFKGNRSKKEQYENDKEIVAYHEAGHAVMSYLLNEPIARASIQSTVSGVGGAVFNEDKDSVFMTNKDFENHILICYAGRASEELKFESVTTGASSDITQATAYMMQYIEKFGFDKDFGLLDISVLNKEHLMDGKDITNKLSEMSKDLYNRCIATLKENYNLVEKLAQKLLAVETLNGNDIVELFNSEVN